MFGINDKKPNQSMIIPPKMRIMVEMDTMRQSVAVKPEIIMDGFAIANILMAGAAQVVSDLQKRAMMEIGGTKKYAIDEQPLNETKAKGGDDGKESNNANSNGRE